MLGLDKINKFGRLIGDQALIQSSLAKYNVLEFFHGFDNAYIPCIESAFIFLGPHSVSALKLKYRVRVREVHYLVCQETELLQEVLHQLEFISDCVFLHLSSELLGLLAHAVLKITYTHNVHIIAGGLSIINITNCMSGLS